MCSCCSTRFTTYEPFRDLSLPLFKEGKGLAAWLGGKYPGSLEECLRSFTSDENLAGEEAF